MRTTILTILAAAAITATTIVACTNSTASDKTIAEVPVSKDSLIKRGEYLVNAMGCDDCHSPKRVGPNGFELIMEKRFSGHPSDVPIGKIDKKVFKEGWMLFTDDLTAAAGPWGVSFTANLTSDSTGIGGWKEEQFIKAIREGKYKGLDGSRPLLPPMPWFVYKNLNDHDLRSIFAFLKSTKPVKNVVPAPIPFKDL